MNPSMSSDNFIWTGSVSFYYSD